MNRQSLLNLITPLAPAVGRITGGHILLRGDGETLSAHAVGESFSISTCEPSPLAIDACPDYTTLKAALSGMAGDALTITPSEGALTLSSRGRRTVRCLPVDAFPALTEEPGKPITIDGDAFRDALQFVSRAVSDDASKPMLHGVHLNGGDVVATDGNRLRIVRLSNDLPAVTIPSAAVAVLMKLLSGPVSVSIGRRATFSGDGFTLSTSLISIPFPASYPRLIPNGDGRVLEADAPAMARAVNAVASFADSKTKRMFLELSDSGAVLSCDAAEEPLDGCDWQGGSHKVLFNGGLMADMLNAFGDQRVEIVFQDSRESFLLFRDSAGRKGVLTPMKF